MVPAKSRKVHSYTLLREPVNQYDGNRNPNSFTFSLHLQYAIIKLIKFVRWDFVYCGHYWPIVPAPDDR
jgi:hypothetical protein